MKEILKISHLTKYYDKTLAVNDLSLSLEEGEIFGEFKILLVKELLGEGL